MMEYNNTLGYYDNHADEFYKRTVHVEFSAMQECFLTKLQTGSYILDFCCDSGLDTKYFLEHGHSVDAVDGSKELCKMASEYTGIEVKNIFLGTVRGG